MKRWLAMGAVVAAVAALGCDEKARLRARREKPWNVLLVTFDTTRADALGSYGNRGGHTPTIDAVAAKGTVFENAVAPMGATFPSHATLFTGLYPRRHGMRANHDQLREELETLAERLRLAGYDTAAFVSYRSMLARGGLHQGFDTLSDPAIGRSVSSIRTGRDVTRLARIWLRAPRDKPFFLWLHYFEPHEPYDLTPYAAAQLRDHASPLAKGIGTRAFYSLLGTLIPWSEETRRALRTLYDGKVRQADSLLDPVVATLARRGLEQDTIVVLTADHGQALGENGRVGHGLLLTETVLRIPLVIRHPGMPEAPKRIAGRVGLVDLLPTLLDLLGLPPLTGLDGRSLVPALAGEPLPERLYFAEMNEPLWDKNPTDIRRRDVVVYEGSMKALQGQSGAKVFDLDQDPSESSPLPPAVQPLRAAELLDLAGSYHDQAVASSGRVVDPEVAAELRALGYLE